MCKKQSEDLNNIKTRTLNHEDLHSDGSEYSSYVLNRLKKHRAWNRTKLQKTVQILIWDCCCYQFYYLIQNFDKSLFHISRIITWNHTGMANLYDSWGKYSRLRNSWPYMRITYLDFETPRFMYCPDLFSGFCLSGFGFPYKIGTP